MSADMNDPVYREIVAARIKMLLENPFFGNLATRLVAVEAPWCRTAATDGRYLYYNREFIKGLSKPKLLFLICHEVLHTVFDHLGRRNGRDPKLWNMACLAWDTPILLADGTVLPIQRILPGDLVASPFGPSRVIGNMFSGIKPTVELVVGDRPLRSTLDHKYASSSGEFLDASKIIDATRDGYILSETGSQGIRSGEPCFHVIDGAFGNDGSRVRFHREFSRPERTESEQVFTQAIQLAAMSVALASGYGVSGRDRGWRGNDIRATSREVRQSHHRYHEHVLALEGLVGGARLLRHGGEKSAETTLLSSHDAWMGDRSGLASVAAVSRHQETARAALAARHGNPEIAAVSWAASGGSLELSGGDFRAERARFSMGEGSGELRPVFDLVTEAGSFFANGVLTHNCDYTINYAIVREKIGQMPEEGLYDEKYTDEMTADEIYELLKKNSVTIKLPLDDHLELGNDDEDRKKQTQKGKSKDGDQGGDGEPEEGDGEGNGEEVSVTVVGKDGPPKLTEEDLQKIRNELKAAIIQTAQQVGAGSVPLGVRRMIQELTEPKLDWRTLLDAHVRSAMKDDYTYQRLSRRTWGIKAILPAQNFMDRVEVFCAIDASGSTTQEMVTDFLSETMGICTSFRDYRVDILCFDTECYNHVVITPENVDDIYNYEIKGNGGTLFECVYEYMKANGIEPHRLIFLTDGLPNSGWGDPDYADTLFIIHSNPHITAPFGISCAYEPKPRKTT